MSHLSLGALFKFGFVFSDLFSFSKLAKFDMGILGLAKLIGDIAPHAIKENEFKNYFGKAFKLTRNVFNTFL